MAAAVEVEILGQKFRVKSDDGEEHLRHVAAYVDGKMKEIGDPEAAISPYTRAVLAALNIASECQKLEQAQTELDKAVGRLTEMLERGAPTLDGKEISERA